MQPRHRLRHMLHEGVIAATACALTLSTGLLVRPAPAFGQESATASKVPNRAAPNVILIMGDDVGFGMASAFGGPVPTPTMDALAAGGLRFNRFHTTAQCSPTRAALLTGRNPHRVNVGAIVNTASADPGYTSVIPTSAATIGKVLSLNGFSTGWFGKGHVTPLADLRAGKFDRWPTGLGFDYYYGMLGGATDQFRPTLVENTTRIPAPAEPRPGYTLEQDLTDHAIAWYRRAKATAPGQPFFLYYATGAVHAPQQAPADWIAKFRGRFDEGWDKLREQTFARQKNEGVIPADAVLTPRPAALPAWDSLSPDDRLVASRMMEVAAAQEAYFDYQVGRLLAAVRQDGLSDNTVVLLINGDNGATQEGTPEGSLYAGRQAAKPSLADIDRFGSAAVPTLYNAGWGWAMNAPFQWYKHMASHLGGTRNGLIVNWPGHVAAPGSIRGQYGFVSDIAPTIYEAAGVVPPRLVDGVKQMPLDGISLAYSFRRPDAPSRRREQYYENNGNRSIYKDGWLAGTTPPKQLWDPGSYPPVQSWSWELYDLRHDFSQSRDLAARYPSRLLALRKAFDAAARANGFAVRQTPEGRPSD